ncbi:MAG: hypothetical protein ACOX9C_06960 [Kiritimatiellia bacterium]|jgi:hypothetical protein
MSRTIIDMNVFCLTGRLGLYCVWFAMAVLLISGTACKMDSMRQDAMHADADKRLLDVPPIGFSSDLQTDGIIVFADAPVLSLATNGEAKVKMSARVWNAIDLPVFLCVKPSIVRLDAVGYVSGENQEGYSGGLPPLVLTDLEGSERYRLLRPPVVNRGAKIHYPYGFHFIQEEFQITDNEVLHADEIRIYLAFHIKGYVLGCTNKFDVKLKRTHSLTPGVLSSNKVYRETVREPPLP